MQNYDVKYLYTTIYGGRKQVTTNVLFLLILNLVATPHNSPKFEI